MNDTEIMTMKFEVWMEGFACSGEGERANAILQSTQEADSFQEACEKAFQDDPNFDATHLTVWGCRLFDNEADARKAFG